MKQRMMEKKVKSALPIYLAAAAFLLAALVLPIYKLWAILIAGAVTALAYAVADKKVPPRVVMVPVPVTTFHTGDAQLDIELTQAQENLDALNLLNERIPDTQISADIERMEQAGNSILQHMQKTVRKARDIRKFVSYYLPTSVKLLTTYADLAASGAQGANAQSMMREIKKNTGIIAAAFEAQLDALFAEKALDVSADITVLDGMMKGDGLAGEHLQAQASVPDLAGLVAQDIAAGTAPGVNTAPAKSAPQAADPMKPNLTL